MQLLLSYSSLNLMNLGFVVTRGLDMDIVNLSRSRKLQVHWIVTANKFVQFAEPYEFRVGRYVRVL